MILRNLCTKVLFQFCEFAECAPYFNAMDFETDEAHGPTSSIQQTCILPAVVMMTLFLIGSGILWYLLSIVQVK